MRFNDARTTQDQHAAFIALFEALAWTFTLDDRLKAHLGQLNAYPHLRGLRHARHAVHHQWDMALELRQGLSSPITSPITSFEWRWVDNLRSSRRSADRQAYLDHLAGKPARMTLHLVREHLSDIAATIR